MFKVPEKYRIKTGALKSDASYGNNGAFRIPVNRLKDHVNVIAADGDGWEHVSVSTPTRTPTWPEMCHVKALFWNDDDLVVQMHVPASDWVNNHPYCLHLWRKAGTNDFCERPPAAMVGFQDLGVIAHRGRS